MKRYFVIAPPDWPPRFLALSARRAFAGSRPRRCALRHLALRQHCRRSHNRAGLCLWRGPADARLARPSQPAPASHSEIGAARHARHRPRHRPGTLRRRAQAMAAPPAASRAFFMRMLTPSHENPEPPSKMAAYKFDAAGHFTVTLANGETWNQDIGDDRHGALEQAGAATYTVQIEPSSSTYHLDEGGNRRNSWCYKRIRSAGQEGIPRFCERRRRRPSDNAPRDHQSCSATKCPADTSSSLGRYCSASGSSTRLDLRKVSGALRSSGEGRSPVSRTRFLARFGSWDLAWAPPKAAPWYRDGADPHKAPRLPPFPPLGPDTEPSPGAKAAAPPTNRG